MNEENKPSNEPTGEETQSKEQPKSREISEEEWQEILEKHVCWLNSDVDRGVRAELHQIRPPPVHLAGVNLVKAIAIGSCFRGHDLSDGDLRWAILDFASFDPANLEHAKLQHASLKSATCTGANLLGAKLQGAYLRYAHLEEADLRSANLTRAVLSDANLQGADARMARMRHIIAIETDFTGAKLDEANLDHAILREATLRDTHLRGASFRSADLSDADLAGAELSGANISGAELTRANVENSILTGTTGWADATLRNANLEGATGLLGDEFAEADLTGVNLPKDIAEFKALDQVAEISKHARTIFVSIIAACVYSWLTIGTTTDAALVANTAATPLPIIQTKVPIAWFYLAAPLVLIGLFVYLHIYLQRMWEALAALPAIFPDGRRLDERAYPWLLSGLVQVHVRRLRMNRPPLSGAQAAISVLFAWGFVPLTVAGFWWRFLPRQDSVWTWFLVAMVWIAWTGAVGFYMLTRITLRSTHEVSLFEREGGAITGSTIALVAALVTAFAMKGPPISVFGFGLYAEINGADVSAKPANWTGLTDRFKTEMAQVRGAQLKGASLRYANGNASFLAKADLSFANLQEANLWDADLQGANLRGANVQGVNLQEADLRNANLERANLKEANLQEAELMEANLKEADLREANLRGAYLRYANLEKADLRDANLQKASLRDANLQGANLRGADLSTAHGLYQRKLDTLCGNDETLLPPGLTIKRCPE